MQDFRHLFNVIVANSRLVHPIRFHAELSSVSKHGKAAYGGKCISYVVCHSVAKYRSGMFIPNHKS
jgi:hypothetical protein